MAGRFPHLYGPQPGGDGRRIDLHAPEHLPRDANGRVGWHFKVSDGRLTTGCGPLDEADMRIAAEYSLVQPLASIPYDDTARAELARCSVREAARSGRFRLTGSVAPSTRFSALAALHDRVAAITR